MNIARYVRVVGIHAVSLALLPAPAVAAHQPRDAGDVTVSTERFQTETKKGIVYHWRARNLQGKAITFRLKRSPVMVWEPSPPTKAACSAVAPVEDLLVWTCEPGGDDAFGFLRVFAKPGEVEFGGGSLSVAYGTTSQQPAVDGLTSAYDASFAQVVFGGGISQLFDDRVNFKLADGALRVTNDSKRRTAALFGAMFRVADVKLWWDQPKQVGALLGLEFTQGTPKVLDAFQFGMGLQVSRYLTVVGGLALRRGEELSRGFELAASDVVSAQQLARNPAYSRFPTVASGRDGYNTDERELLDGLPLNAPGTDKPFFPGSPINESYNHSFFIGFVVPINLKALVQPQP